MSENKPLICGITKGDSITLECTIKSDITDWKIRAEIFDDCNSIKLATANVTGGSDDQIKIISTSTSESVFEIYVEKDKTTCFETKSEIEIEVETDNIVAGSSEKKTILNGFIEFELEQITWDEVNG